MRLYYTGVLNRGRTLPVECQKPWVEKSGARLEKRVVMAPIAFFMGDRDKSAGAGVNYLGSATFLGIGALDRWFMTLGVVPWGAPVAGRVE